MHYFVNEPFHATMSHMLINLLKSGGGDSERLLMKRSLAASNSAELAKSSGLDRVFRTADLAAQLASYGQMVQPEQASTESQPSNEAQEANHAEHESDKA